MRMCYNVFCYRSAVGRLLNIIVFMINARQTLNAPCCRCQFPGYRPFGASDGSVPYHPDCNSKRAIDFLYVEFTEAVGYDVKPSCWKWDNCIFYYKNYTSTNLENHEGTSYTCLVVMLMVLFIAKENWIISYHLYVSSQPFSSGLVQHKEFSLIMHADVVVSLTTMEFLILLNPLEKIATKKKQHAHATVSSGSRFNGSGSVKLETEKTCKKNKNYKFDTFGILYENLKR